MIDEQFERCALLLSSQSIEKLNNSKVAIFGLGGVGSYVLEILCRSGVGKFVLIDGDKVARSNLNRQLIALNSTIDDYKTFVAKNRAIDINNLVEIQTYATFVSDENINDIDLSDCDYIVDAIDDIEGKLSIIKKSKQENIPIISCMGTGNKLDPSKLKIADINKTEMCPLAKKMRRLLKDEGIDKVKVLFSTESVVFKSSEVIASVAFVPSVAGILIAREVILDLK